MDIFKRRPPRYLVRYSPVSFTAGLVSLLTQPVARFPVGLGKTAQMPVKARLTGQVDRVSQTHHQVLCLGPDVEAAFFHIAGPRIDGKVRSGSDGKNKTRNVQRQGPGI